MAIYYDSKVSSPETANTEVLNVKGETTPDKARVRTTNEAEEPESSTYIDLVNGFVLKKPKFRKG